MNVLYKVLFGVGIVFYCLALLPVRAQFVNLDFESATLPSIPVGPSGGYVPVSQAMPGWRVFFGDREQSLVLHNNFALGSTSASIFGPEDTFGIIEGRYTPALQAGFDFGPPAAFREAALAQTGLVPVDAASLQFKMAPFGAGHLFRVELGSQQLTLVPLFVYPNYTLFGADISSFAGTTAELRFIAETIQQGSNITLDSIVFSSVPVPEPGTWALLSIGLVCFVAYMRKCGQR